VEQLVKKHGSVTSTVGNVAHVLRKIGKYSGVLEPNEISEVQKSHETLRGLLSRRRRPRQDRDQELLNQLDDPRLVDALLTLARRTVKAVVGSRKRTRRNACMIQRALILEIWLCAPLRIKNLVGLRLDEHFFKMTLDKVERIVIRTPAVETKNSEATEHILNDDTKELLQLYLDVYRPIIDKPPSPWLFPGADGHHKRENTLGTQMATWIRKELGIHFHPHVIRKIVPKLYLDADPSGLEVVRRQLGHKSDQMLRGRICSACIARPSVSILRRSKVGD
jgi:integrase